MYGKYVTEIVLVAKKEFSLIIYTFVFELQQSQKKTMEYLYQGFSRTVRCCAGFLRTNPRGRKS